MTNPRIVPFDKTAFEEGENAPRHKEIAQKVSKCLSQNKDNMKTVADHVAANNQRYFEKANVAGKTSN